MTVPTVVRAAALPKGEPVATTNSSLLVSFGTLGSWFSKVFSSLSLTVVIAEALPKGEVDLPKGERVATTAAITK